MADTGKQSPLGANFTSSLLLNQGLSINPVARQYLGVSKNNRDYTPGKLVNDTCLKWLTYAINDAYKNGAPSQPRVTAPNLVNGVQYTIVFVGNTDFTVVGASSNTVGTVFTADLSTSVAVGTGEVLLTPNTNPVTATVSVDQYNNLLAMGQSRIPALSNSFPPSYVVNDPSNVWNGEATAGYAIPGDGRDYPTDYLAGQGQRATWFPYDSSNPNNSITQWGFLRCLALQAWNVFNWNGKDVNQETPEYKDYVSSFMTIDGFIKFSNESIMSLRNSVDFLKGTFSNMNDLITADITGVTLSTQAFGQDLINLGKALDLSTINSFGLPSNLLKNLKSNNALTQAISLALMVSGLSASEIESISIGESTATKDQEQKIYSAFLIIQNSDLTSVLETLNCKTRNLETLADLLNVKKMFPISFTTLTVPIYNTSPGPTNSKTYYLLFVDRELNPQLIAPKVKAIVGTIVPQLEPPVIQEPLPEVIPEIIKQEIINPLPPPPTAPPPATGGGGGCVVLDAYVPTVETRLHNGKSVEKAWQIENDFDILLADEQLKSTKGKVVKALIDFQPCVRIITASGIRLSCSTTAPILTKNKGYVEAPKLFGELIAVMRNDIAFYDEVVSIDDIGYKHVRVIDTGDNSFWAGDIQNAYILHHNVLIRDEISYIKK